MKVTYTGATGKARQEAAITSLVMLATALSFAELCAALETLVLERPDAEIKPLARLASALDKAVWSRIEP